MNWKPTKWATRKRTSLTRASARVCMCVGAFGFAFIYYCVCVAFVFFFICVWFSVGTKIKNTMCCKPHGLKVDSKSISFVTSNCVRGTETACSAAHTPTRTKTKTSPMPGNVAVSCVSARVRSASPSNGGSFMRGPNLRCSARERWPPKTCLISTGNTDSIYLCFGVRVLIGPTNGSRTNREENCTSVLCHCVQSRDGGYAWVCVRLS